MLKLEEMRKLLRKQCAKTAGQDGEEYAEKWLNNSGWEFERVEQGVNTLSQKLKDYGGKRPDFIVKADVKDFILLDVKYYNTENSTSFTLTIDEIKKYKSLKSYLKSNIEDCNFDVVFMVFPKEKDGKEFTFVSLDEIYKGENVKVSILHDAKKISIQDRSELWFSN